MRRQIALTLARTPGLHQHLTHLLERDRSGDHPKADVVADTHAGWQCGGSSTHGAYSPPVHSRLGDRSRYVNRIGVYPEATHAFDYHLPPMHYLGHFMQYDDAATRDAEVQVRDFLHRVLGERAEGAR